MMRIAAIQMCSVESVDENLAVAARLIGKAAAQGAVLAVLPEMFATFGQMPAQVLKMKETTGGGKLQDFLAALALKHQIWIVGGTIPMMGSEPHKVRAASFIFNARGDCVARYDKKHLFDVVLSQTERYCESDLYEPGEDLVVVDTPVGALGVCICYDIRFPLMFAELFEKGAEVIAIPAAFTRYTGQAHWELLMRCRAIDSFCYVVGAGQGGMHFNDRESYGHSMVVDPWGQVMASLKTSGKGVILAEVDLLQLHTIRKKMLKG